MGKRRKKSKKHYDDSNVEDETIKGLRQLCPLNEFRVIRPDNLKSLNLEFKDLLDKIDSVLLVCSGSSESEAYYMTNLNRVDFKPKEIDHAVRHILFWFNASDKRLANSAW